MSIEQTNPDCPHCKYVREEIVEHVMDGADYNFIAAIVYIRDWREKLHEARKLLAEARDEAIRVYGQPDKCFRLDVIVKLNNFLL